MGKRRALGQQLGKLNAGERSADRTELTFDSRWPIWFWIERLLLRMSAVQIEHDHSSCPPE